MRLFNINNIKIIVIILSFGMMLSGCGAQKKWFRDRSDDYKKAKSYPTIQIPSGVNAEACSQEYAIPGH